MLGARPFTAFLLSLIRFVNERGKEHKHFLTIFSNIVASGNFHYLKAFSRFGVHIS